MARREGRSEEEIKDELYRRYQRGEIELEERTRPLTATRKETSRAGMKGEERKRGLDEDRSFEDLSAAELQSYTKGIHYPKSKQDIIDYMVSQGAPRAVERELQRMPDKEYRTAADLSHEFGQLK